MSDRLWKGCLVANAALIAFTPPLLGAWDQLPLWMAVATVYLHNVWPKDE